MMFRFSAATLLVFILACGGLEIGGGQPSKSAAQQVPIQTDLNSLRRQVRLPKAATSCQFQRWRLGFSSRIGPTDYKLVSWVALSSMDELDAMFGPPEESLEPYLLYPDESALIPPAILATLDRNPDGLVLLPGNFRRPEHTGGMTVTRVIEVADAGILLWAMTM